MMNNKANIENDRRSPPAISTIIKERHTPLLGQIKARTHLPIQSIPVYSTITL